MFDIKLDNQFIDISDDETLQLEYQNTLFTDDALAGSYSFDFQAISSPKNKILFGFLDSMDSATVFQKEYEAELWIENKYFSSAKLNVKKTSSSAGFQCYLLLSISSFVDKIKDTSLRNIDWPGGNDYNTPLQVSFYNYTLDDEGLPPYAVFYNAQWKRVATDTLLTLVFDTEHSNGQHTVSVPWNTDTTKILNQAGVPMGIVEKTAVDLQKAIDAIFAVYGEEPDFKIVGFYDDSVDNQAYFKAVTFNSEGLNTFYWQYEHTTGHWEHVWVDVPNAWPPGYLQHVWVEEPQRANGLYTVTGRVNTSPKASKTSAYTKINKLEFTSGAIPHKITSYGGNEELVFFKRSVIEMKNMSENMDDTSLPFAFPEIHTPKFFKEDIESTDIYFNAFDKIYGNYEYFITSNSAPYYLFAPQPKLNWLFGALRHHLGGRLQTDLFTNPDYAPFFNSLLVFSLWAGNRYEDSINGQWKLAYGNLMPNKTVAEFLRVLKNTFCLGIDQEYVSGRLRLIPFRTINESTAFVDISDQITTNYEIEPSGINNTKLAFTLDSGDETMKAIEKQENYEFLGEYDTFASLPISTSLKNNQVMYVRGEGKYYYWKAPAKIETPLQNHWTFLSYIKDTDKGNGETLETGSGTFATKRLWTSLDQKQDMLLVLQNGDADYYGQKSEGNWEFRFYRFDMEHWQQNPENIRIPMGKPLSLSGEYGLYDYFHKPMVDFKGKTKLMRFGAYIYGNTLKTLDMFKKYRIKSQLFYIKTLRVTIPHRTAQKLKRYKAELEMYIVK